MDVPTGLKAIVENNTSIIITGADNNCLASLRLKFGQSDRRSRLKAKEEYAEEHIVRKEGKKK